jgi:hypothetical protein
LAPTYPKQNFLSDPGNRSVIGTGFELKGKEKIIGGEKNVNGKIGSAQRSCPAVGGFPFHYLPLVLGRQVKRRQTQDRQFAHSGDFGGGDGR